MALEEYVRKRKFENTPEPPPANRGQPGRLPTERAALLRAASRRHPPALRFPPGDRRRAGFLGGSQRSVARAALQAFLAAKVEDHPLEYGELRGQHSGRQLRRRQRDAVGPRHLGTAGRRAGGRATRARRSQVPPARRKAQGRVRAGAHEESRQGQRMAADQEARRRRRARLGHRATRLERALRPHAAGDRAGLARPQDQAEDGRRSAARMEEPPAAHAVQDGRQSRAAAPKPKPPSTPPR